MDYEQKYKEILEMAREAFYSPETPHVAKAWLLTMFPALAESEDEKIRKELIGIYSVGAKVNAKTGDILDRDIVAWLEKQDGKNKVKSEIVKDYIGEENVWNDARYFRPKHLQRYQCYDKYMGGVYCYVYDDISKYWCTQTTEEHDPDGDNHISDYSDYRVTAWRELPTTPFYPSKDSIEKQGKSALEAIKEEQVDNANKVEPKFKVCDCVISNDGTHTYLVKERKRGTYVMLDIGDDEEFNIIIETADRTGRLWTIEDAKDGDVLISQSGNPLIYNGNYNSLDIGAYCGITCDGKFKVGVEKCNWTENIDIKPSTKEQRDLLFAKMKETGYEWDSKKKELKIIEQKSSDKVKPKFHPGDWVIDNFGNTYQIKTATEIESEHIFGYTIVGGGYFNDNNDVRLWTIKDAKDGDVLVDKDNNIGLYLEEKDDLYWHSCIYLGCDDRLRGFSIGGYHNHKNTKPATKEQCELLFAKIKEMGYEWDGEKKELKKIKSKTLDSDKVIKWLEDMLQASVGARVFPRQRLIDKFKKDFGL